MNRINAAVTERFRRSSLLRAGALVAAIGLLAVCSVGLWKSLAITPDRQEKVTRVTYSQTGDFGYTARVVNNDLYGNATLTQQDTSLLFLAITESIGGSFSCRFVSNPEATAVVHTARIDAIIASSDQWSKTLELVPASTYSGPFTISFQIDTDGFFDLINAIESQIAVKGSSYDLTIRATVRTTGQTDYGPISELMTRNLTAKLRPATLTWTSGDFAGQPQYGSIQETVTIPAESGGNSTWWAIALGFVVLLGSYVAWSYVQSRPAPLGLADAEFGRARKKHEDVIVDVDDLPEAGGRRAGAMFGPSETVVLVASLDELVKVSESLLKPILHLAEPGRHTYRVIDGPTTYEYVSKPEPTMTDFEAEGEHYFP
jgi:hypothetical protein